MDFLKYHDQSLTEWVSQEVFDFQVWDYEVPVNFAQLGFTSKNYFLISSGVNLLHCLIVIPIFFALMILGLGKWRWRAWSAPFDKLHSIFSNNFYVRYNLETYFVYSVCTITSVYEPTFYNWATSLQFFVAALHLLFLLFLPLTVIFFYNWSYEKLVKNKAFRASWGSLYLGLVVE